MNGFVLAAAVLASALAGGALAWPIAKLGWRQMVRELQASAAALADERARLMAMIHAQDRGRVMLRVARQAEGEGARCMSPACRARAWR